MSDFSAVRMLYGPWIDGLPGGERFLSAANALFFSRDFPSLVQALKGLFVGQLRYESRELNHRARLDGQAQISDLFTVAEHQGFCISAARLGTFVRYLSSVDAVFRFVPNGLVFTLDPAGRMLRLHYQSRAGERTHRAVFLRGDDEDRQCGEDLLTWAYRLSQLEPRHDEGLSSMEQRLASTIETPSSRLCHGWPSAVLESENIPGPPLTRASSVETLSFLQWGIDYQRQAAWGLRAVLESFFPFVLSQGKRELELIGVEILDVSGCCFGPCTGVCLPVMDGTSRVAEVGAHVNMVEDGGTTGNFMLRFALPVPCGDGAFVLNGTPYRFERAVVDPDGRTQRLGGIRDERQLGLEADVRRGRTLLRLADLMRLVLANRFKAMAVSAWRADEDATASKAKLLLLWKRSLDKDGRLHVASVSRLRRILKAAPCDGVRAGRSVVRSSGFGDSPPSFACLDSSLSAEPGSWIAVSSARLAPGGHLAIPVEDSGSRRLVASGRSAFEVNPRLMGKQGEGDAGHWIADGLQPWSHNAVGRLKHAGHLHRSLDRVLPVKIFRMPGQTLKARLRRGLLPRRKTKVWHHSIDLPCWIDEERIRFLVSVGQVLSCGDSWLSYVAGEDWCDDEDGALLKRLGSSLEREVPGGGTIRYRLPVPLRGKVEELSIHQVQSLGGYALFTRVNIVLRESMRISHVVLDDGRWAPCEGFLPTEDLPFDQEGTTCDILLQDPLLPFQPARGQGGCIRDGGTGLAVHGRWKESVCSIQYASVDVTPKSFRVEHRAFDGGGVPGHAESPMLTHGECMDLALSRPWIASHLNEAMSRRGSGIPPWMDRLIDLLVDLRLPLPSCVPVEWRGLGKCTSMDKGFDPTLTRVENIVSRDYSEYWCWACPECGKRRASAGLARRCKECECDLVGRPAWMGSDLVVESIRLAKPMLHPWKIGLAALTLGLTEGELNELLKDHPSAGIEALLEIAALQPLGRAQLRLQEEKDGEKKSQLVSLLHRHGQRLATLQNERSWLIDHVPIISRTLRPIGLPEGGPALMLATINTCYRSLQESLRQRVQDRVPDGSLIWNFISLHVEKKARAVFVGDEAHPDPTDDFRSISSILRRLWPLTRRRDVPVASRCFGTRRTSERAYQVGLHTSAFPLERWMAGEGSPSLERRCLTPDPGDPQFWEARRLVHQFGEGPSLKLALILARIDQGEERFLPDIRGWGEGAVLFDRGQLGYYLTALLMTQIVRKGKEATPFLEQLLSSIPLRLSNDAPAARSAIAERLAFIDPAKSEGLACLHSILMRILVSWWLVRSESGAQEWVWCDDENGPSEGGQRFAPSLRSSAWQIWPWVGAMEEPELWFESKEAVEETWPTTLRALVGFGELSLHEAFSRLPTLFEGDRIEPVVPVPWTEADPVEQEGEEEESGDAAASLEDEGGQDEKRETTRFQGSFGDWLRGDG